MTIKAFILITTDTPKAGTVVQKLREVPGVTEAHEVMGPYDIVAVMEVEELTDVPSVLGQHIRVIDGIRSTLTCVTMP